MGEDAASIGVRQLFLLNNPTLSTSRVRAYDVYARVKKFAHSQELHI